MCVLLVLKMEVQALRVVKQEENPHDFNFPQSLNHTNERQYHDPTMIESVPLAKFQRALNPVVEQLSATLQTTPNVETDNVHHTNGLEPLAVAAPDKISTEEPPDARATDKAQVVAEMVEYAFATCEGSNSNPGTKMMVSNLLQFLSKQYEEDKALAVVEIERLKDEKMKLEEERNLALGNFQKSESELEDLKKRSLQQVNLLKATIRDRDKRIDLHNEEMTVLRERVGKETHHVPETIPNPPLVISKSTQVPPDLSPCDPDTQETEEPKRKRTRCQKGLDCAASVSISGSMNALAPQKFGAELSSVLTAILTLGKALDCNLKGALSMVPVAMPQKMVPRENQWIHCISRIVPPGYRFDTNTIFKKRDAYKMVWNHWISAVMFHEFEDSSFGLKEEAVATPEKNLDAASTKLPGTFDGNCSQFLAFVKRKHHLLFPLWMYQPPLLKILDGDVYLKFKVIAEKIWMLHQIGRGCELPPSIFRPVPLGTRYDARYHESRTPLPAGTEKEPLIIMLVFMPGFVVGETVIKSQVAVKKM